MFYESSSRWTTGGTARNADSLSILKINRKYNRKLDKRHTTPASGGGTVLFNNDSIREYTLFIAGNGDLSI
ncbi:hypothetical protein [Dyadobacter tibetensis]|uniref:hypothetical protein n=1 Tax=Dyadobacter tibetensis TaxID=1211851 RepID=UPI00047144F3|nr:hypothetical protein [Dyadobacter tibetensis]